MRAGLIVMTALAAVAFEGPASAQTAATRPATAPATTTAPAAGDGIRQGKVAEPVESAGLILTVRVSREPEARWKPIIRIAEDQKYVDLEILLENKTGDALRYYPSLMKLKDSEDQEYGHDAMVGVGQPLEFGSVPHGQRVRGHLSYTLPKTAHGLRFTYTFEGLRGYLPIYINLPDE